MNGQQFKAWCAESSAVAGDRPLLMGIINATPDSFFSGSRQQHADAALCQALLMVAEGADLLDIGGESSRPGALPVSVQEEMDRVLPIIEHLRQEMACCLSIDTTKPEIMRAALAAGVDVVNDVSALRHPESFSVLAQSDCPIILTHMQGAPATMQDAPCYAEDMIAIITDFFIERQAACTAAGIAPSRLIVDPGFGFGKTTAHNLYLIASLGRFKALQRPLLLGLSRKTSIGEILQHCPPDERLYGSLGLTTIALTVAPPAILRVHDVAATRDVVRVWQAFTEIEC